jgi:hypothetical protein
VRVVAWTLCLFLATPAFASPGAREAWFTAGDQEAFALCRDGESLRVVAEANPYDPVKL